MPHQHPDRISARLSIDLETDDWFSILYRTRGLLFRFSRPRRRTPASAVPAAQPAGSSVWVRNSVGVEIGYPIARSRLLTEACRYRVLEAPVRPHSRPFEGNEPHGSIQQVLDTSVKVQKKTGRVIVKVNHMGEGADIDTVHANPNKYVAAYTVMFKKPKGYDPENQDWFWVKYNPDGSLDTNPMGMMLAGRVAKGMDRGCIACHRSIGGDDLEILKK